MGMVIASVNVPHGESLSAFTTMSATAARRMTMMARTASIASIPPRLPTSSRAIWPRDFPLRRIEKNSVVKSWTQPPSAAPRMSQSVPGKYPNCAASVGPTRGPGPAIAAK